MAQVYIRPEDVGPEQAQIVLDFLNRAQSAQEIADTIEIPGELDVGLRVAQRILARRAALGGRFTTLAQVKAVPYVGPERFSEIVSVLTGLRPIQTAAASDFQARVLRELQTLRAMLAALQAGASGPRLKLSLHATLEDGFLGQAIPLRVEVRDRITGNPVPNARLTVSAGWGDLKAYVGLEEKWGRALSVHTNLNGRVELIYLPPTAEALTPEQQVALETALRELDPDAHSPLDILPQLERLVRRYQADNDPELRAAIDITFSDRYAQLTHAVNPGTRMGGWRRCQAPIRADLHEDDQGAGVQATAVLNLGMKDWLRPWYQAYLALSERESQLQAEIDALGEATQETSTLLDGILNNVYGFIGVQTGRVGESIGQKVAWKTLNRFMAVKMDDLPLASRQTLLPTLSIAARTIRADTMGSLAVSARISKDIKADVTGQLAPLGDVGTLADKIDTVQTQLDRFQADYRSFNEKTASIENNLTTFSTSYEKFTTDYTQFRKDFDGRIVTG